MFSGTFVSFFLKAFIRTGVITVVLFSELSQGTKILVVFLFKFYMRSAVFRVFCCIYTFVFRALMRTRVFNFFLKVLRMT